MAEYTIEMGPHPGHKRGADGEPLTKDGQPVPLFEWPKTVNMITGKRRQILAYVTESGDVSFIVNREQLGPLAAEVLAAAKAGTGKDPAKVKSVPPPTQPEPGVDADG